MKKLLSVIFILLVILLVGCSGSNEVMTQKNKEELKAEIESVIQAQEKMKVELKDELKKEIKEELKKELKEELKKEFMNNEDLNNVAEQNTTEETEIEKEPIVLSVSMTKEDIIKKLGDDYTFETKEDGGYYMYYSNLAYDGINFTFYHNDKEFPANSNPDYIYITSNKYKYNYDFKIGDSALKALEYCEDNFENAYDHHGDRDIFDVFNYPEKNGVGKLENTGYVIRWQYDTQKDYQNKEQISKDDAKVKSISIFYFLD